MPIKIAQGPESRKSCYIDCDQRDGPNATKERSASSNEGGAREKGKYLGEDNRGQRLASRLGKRKISIPLTKKKQRVKSSQGNRSLNSRTGMAKDPRCEKTLEKG